MRPSLSPQRHPVGLRDRHRQLDIGSWRTPGVAGFVDPAMLVEIEADAVVDDGDRR